MRFVTVATALSFLLLLGIGVGCTNNSNNTPSSGSFYGTYSEATGVHGTIALSGVAPATGLNMLGGAASTPMTGTLDIPGQLPIDLSGDYFPETGALSFTSANDTYAFTGQVSGASAVGTSTGPNGAGSFALFTGGTPSTVAVFCGSGKCDPVACQGGTPLFNLGVSGLTALMTVSFNAQVFSGAGSRNGDIVNFHLTGEGFDVTIQGSINGNNVGGSWADNLGGGGGLWSGSTNQCTVAGVRLQ